MTSWFDTMNNQLFRPLRFNCVAVVVGALTAASGCAAQKPVDTIAPAECRQITSQEAEWLGSAWRPYIPVTDVCLVARAGPPVLLIAAVSAVRYYQPLPAGSTTVEFPKPVLLTSEGRPVGQLPYNYPDDPPFALEVTFDEWDQGFPQRIRLILRDPTVSGDHDLPPLRWDRSQKKFVPEIRDQN